MNIEQVRAELQAGGLGDDIERHDPFELLQQWVDFAADAGFFNPSAMALKTPSRRRSNCANVSRETP